MRKSMEEIIAGSSEAIDAFTTNTMAKVSPVLLRRRSPSPAAAASSTTTGAANASPTQGHSLSPSSAAAATAAGATNTSSGSGSTGGGGSAGHKQPSVSDQYLSPYFNARSDIGCSSEPDGKGKSSSDGSSSQHSFASPSSSSSSSDATQLGPDGGALFKSPSAGSDIASKGSSKGKIPNQAKKKSWYSVFYPSYKSRSADFKKLFKDVPDDERLLVDYSSALQRDILVHGRLYVSQSYLCFYSNIFGWETCLTIKLKEVTAVTKEKTALVIPNAILVCTEHEKHFFTSFTARDNTYLMLFRVWQNALMDKAMQPAEMWQWVHYIYGDELGLTTDDEDYIDPYDDLPRGKPKKSLMYMKLHGTPANTNSNTDSVSEEQSNPESSDNTGSGCGAGCDSNQLENDKWSGGGVSGGASVAGGGNSDGGRENVAAAAGGGGGATAKPYSQTSSKAAVGDTAGNTPRGGLVENSDLEGPCLKHQGKDPKAVAAAAAAGSGAGKSNRKSLPILGSSRSGATGSVSGGVGGAIGVGPGGGVVVRQLEDPNLDQIPTDMSDTTDSEQDKNLDLIGQAECTSNHEGRQMIHTILPINVDILFTLLFSKSKFLENFHANRKTTDLVFGDWLLEDNKKLRTVKLTVALTQPVGPKCSQVTEKQTLRECSVPGQLYSVDIISTNAGIPYAESFFVTMHYCMVRTVDDHTMFSVHTQIQYKKSVWGVVKGFIEKNTWNGLEDFYTALVRALQTEYGIPPAKSKSRRARRGTTMQKPVDVFDPTVNRLVKTKSATLPRMSSTAVVVAASSSSGMAGGAGGEVAAKVQYKSMSLFVIVLLLLLIGLNAVLYVKLWELEKMEAHKFQYPDFSKLRDPPKSHEDWLRIMQEQEHLHNAEMGKWQSVLQIAVDLLRKVSVVCKKIVKNAKVDQLDLMSDDEDDDESLFSVADDLLRHGEF